VPGWVQASSVLQLDGENAATLPGRDSVLVDWPFAPLTAGSRHALRVRVTGEDGSASNWSEPQEIVAAFLADGRWKAKLVGLADPQNPAQPALLRTEFTVAGEVARATLYATAHGGYQVEVNGTEVDDQILKPGWTSYQFHLIHETTDVTGLIHEGANAIGANLGGAWYTENFGFREGASRFYGEQPSVAAQLVIEYADGHSETIVTDGSWRANGTSPILASSIYQGESYDARSPDGPPPGSTTPVGRRCASRLRSSRCLRRGSHPRCARSRSFRSSTRLSRRAARRSSTSDRTSSGDCA
jgi:alpha-L-rhamnosidase